MIFVEKAILRRYLSDDVCLAIDSMPHMLN